MPKIFRKKNLDFVEPSKDAVEVSYAKAQRLRDKMTAIGKV